MFLQELQQKSLWEYSTWCTIGVEVQKIHQGLRVLLNSSKLLVSAGGARVQALFRCTHNRALVLPTLRYLLCLLSISPPAVRHVLLAQIVLLGWVMVSFQCYTHLWWTYCWFERSLSSFVLALYLCATLIAETFWDAFWIAYEPCGRVCAGGLLFTQFSLKNYPLNVNMCVIIKQPKCCQSSLMFEMPKILFPSYSHSTVTETHYRLSLNKTPSFFYVHGYEKGVGRFSVWNYPGRLLSQRHARLPLPQSYIDQTSPPSG